MSAGGEGNVAVPLLKGDLKEPHAFNRSQIQNLLGFFGSVENGPRQRLLMKVCVYVCIYMFVYMCMYVYVCIFACMCTGKHVYILTCMCV